MALMLGDVDFEIGVAVEREDLLSRNDDGLAWLLMVLRLCCFLRDGSFAVVPRQT